MFRAVGSKSGAAFDTVGLKRGPRAERLRTLCAEGRVECGDAFCDHRELVLKIAGTPIGGVGTPIFSPHFAHKGDGTQILHGRERQQHRLDKWVLTEWLIGLDPAIKVLHEPRIDGATVVPDLLVILPDGMLVAIEFQFAKTTRKRVWAKIEAYRRLGIGVVYLWGDVGHYARRSHKPGMPDPSESLAADGVPVRWFHARTRRVAVLRSETGPLSEARRDSLVGRFRWASVQRVHLDRCDFGPFGLWTPVDSIEKAMEAANRMEGRQRWWVAVRELADEVRIRVLWGPNGTTYSSAEVAAAVGWKIEVRPGRVIVVSPEPGGEALCAAICRRLRPRLMEMGRGWLLRSA